jgi:uncharacterized protein (TIGR02246 family)
MRRVLLFTLAVMLTASPGTLAHRHVPRELVTSFEQAWNQHNASDLAALFTEDGSFGHPFAQPPEGLVRSRQNVESYLKTAFGGALSKSTYKVKTETVQEWQLRGLLVLDFEATITGVAGAPASIDHRTTMILEQSSGGIKEPQGNEHKQHWSIAVLRLIVPMSEAAKAAAAR